MLKDILDVIQKNVSRETFSMLQQYFLLLEEGNQKVNLISRRATPVEIWKSHILDSLILSDYIDEKDGLLYDIGSGAGLPGLILAMNGHHKCVLVEINAKKVAFLEYVKETMGLKNVTIVHQDVRKIKDISPRYIVSRALARPTELIKFTKNIFKKNTELILHVGEKNMVEEMAILKKQKIYQLHEWQNPYKTKCRIISVKNL